MADNNRHTLETSEQLFPVGYDSAEKNYSKLGNLKLNVLSQQIQEPYKKERVEPQILEALSQEEMLRELEPLWENFDFENFDVDDEHEAFKSHVMMAFTKINSYLEIAQQPRELEKLRGINNIISEKVENIWRTEMEGMFNGSEISLEEVWFTLLGSHSKSFYNELTTAYKQNDKNSDIYRDFIKKGGTDIQWENSRKEYSQEQENKHQDENKAFESVTKNPLKNGIESNPLLQLNPQFTTDEYIDLSAQWILRDTNETGRFNFLLKGTMQEPFVEVITFLQNGGKGEISPEAYRAMVSLKNNGERSTKQKKWITRKVKKVQSKLNTYNKRKNGKNPIDDKGIYESVQKEVLVSDNLYQLGMQKLAEQAFSIISKNPVQFVKGENAQQQVEFMNKRASSYDGYIVKNQESEQANSSLDSQLAGRLTPTNFLLDKIIGTGGLIMAGVNILIGIKSGNWMGVFPYVATGLGLNVLMYKGVVDEGFNRALHPDQMLNNIVKESSYNKDYMPYFSNEWEIALANAIEWPDKRGKRSMRQKFKAIKKEQKRTTISNVDEETGKVTSERKLHPFKSQDNRQKKYFEENITPIHFKKGNPLASYLPDTHIPGPDGQMYTKDNFLDRVYENEKRTGMNGHIRYKMLDRMAGRIGQNNSYLPLLNQLHSHYSLKQKKLIATNLKRLKTKEA